MHMEVREQQEINGDRTLEKFEGELATLTVEWS